MQILNADDILACISMREAIEVVKDAFRQLSAGLAQVPLRTHLSLADGDSFFMPAALSKPDVSGVKVVSVREKNPAQGLPTVPALMVLMDAHTGLSRAVLDGTFLTKLRTGAAVGAATDLLANKEAAVLAMIGAGALAPFCIQAVCAVRGIRHVKIYSRTPQRVEQLVSWCAGELAGARVVSCANSSDAVREADVVVCATTSSTPVFSGSDLKQGAHVNGVGSYRPDMQEVDETTVKRAKIVVDSVQACLQEAGDLIIPLERGIITPESIHGELGEVIAGTKPGRESNDEIIFFKSVGNAVQDVGVARAVVERAEQLRVGHVVHL